MLSDSPWPPTRFRRLPHREPDIIAFLSTRPTFLCADVPEHSPALKGTAAFRVRLHTRRLQMGVPGLRFAARLPAPPHPSSPPSYRPCTLLPRHHSAPPPLGPSAPPRALTPLLDPLRPASRPSSLRPSGCTSAAPLPNSAPPPLRPSAARVRARRSLPPGQLRATPPLRARPSDPIRPSLPTSSLQPPPPRNAALLPSVFT